LGGEPAKGFIISEDNRMTWKKHDDPVLMSEGISSIAANSKYVFVGTYASGVFRSDDDGETWENVFAAVKSGGAAWNMAVDGHNVLVFIYGNGLYHSADNGLHWTNITGDIDVKWGSGAVFIKGQTILFATDRFYRSVDLGATWKEIKSVESGMAATAGVSSIISDDNIIYASAGEVHYSLDDGESWISLPNKDSFYDPAIKLASNDRYIFARDQFNIFRINKVRE